MQTVNRTASTTARSAELRDQARRLTPGGVHSNVRLLGPQLFIDHAKGPRLVDVDGNDYLDYLLGQGPNFLGHAPDDVLDAVDAACRRGMVFGAQHELEITAAQAVLDAIGWADSMRFAGTGSEAVQAVLRAARAATGRRKFIRFAGHYHGWLDNVLVNVGIDGCDAEVASAGQLPGHLDDSIMLPWNDLALVADVLEDLHDDVAAVITEPVMLNAGSIEPAGGFLEGLRALCDRYGVALIFDEVISGFRIALGGAAERYGVTPDLATYGKAIAGGWSVAAFAGTDRFMRGFGTGTISHAGTFNASVVACAATAATVQRLRDKPPYAELERLGSRLQSGLHDLAMEHGVPLHVQGLPMAFHVGFGSGPITDHATLQRLDLAGYAEFARVLVEHGVWVSGRGIWYLSTAHTDADIDETLERASAAMAAWRQR
jgi:glutamate-1-semialdehyde 2,1-aminomutase